MKRKCSICGAIVEGYGEALLHMVNHPNQHVKMIGEKGKCKKRI